jgi:two-component system, LytTR family, sensor kinase
LKKRLTNLAFVGVNFTCGMTYEKFSPIKMKELENKNSLRKTIISHFLIWVLYLILQLWWRFDEYTIYDILPATIQVITWAALFYTVRLYLYPKYLWKNHFKLLLAFILIYPIFQTVTFFYINYFQELKGKEIDSILTYIKRGSFWYFNISFMAFGFTYYDELGNEKEKIKQLELKLKNAELENLKAQFNPHFLFNILWYIYFLVDKTGDKDATKAVTLLSDMMRYSMQKWEVGEFAKLEEEVEYVNNFIELQRLKNPKMCLDYQTEGDMEGVKILPLVMMSFVENGFKHGQTHDPENPLTIRLKVEKGENFIFSVKNKVSTMGKERSSGIGLENVKSRLETAYKEKYNLEITQDKEFYTTKLTIDI